MTGSPQTDPRLNLAGLDETHLESLAELIRYGIDNDQSPEMVARAIDAADEASGVRRVTAQEFDSMRQALQHFAAHGLSADLTPTMDCRSTDALYVGFSGYLRRLDQHVRDDAQRALSTSAADSPVGGVS